MLHEVQRVRRQRRAFLEAVLLCGGLSLLLLLQEAMNLEPIGATTIARSRLGHSNQNAFPQAASFAGSSVFLIDYAFAVVFALRYRR